MHSWPVRSLVLCALLASAPARADPEGYQGGEGRPHGTTYTPPYEGPSVTVRRVTVETTIVDDRWTCDGRPTTQGTYDLVTVVLDLSNRTNYPVSSHLPLLDLVIGRDDVQVVQGTCTRNGRPVAEADLEAKKGRRVRTQFLIPRGEVPKILVYNDDDFPALFALPRAKRLPAPAKRR